MKRSTQWDVVGILGLFLGISMFMAMIYSGLYYTNDPHLYYSAGWGISKLIEYYGNPLLGVFCIAFSFMCFFFGHSESKKA